MKLITVPTGKIGIYDGEHGPLECLYVADYGKNQNMHADFLGIHQEIETVNGTLMPLEEKIVVTISTQYGCASRCKFCDVPKAGKGRNATKQDMLRQVAWMIVESGCQHTKRLNVHFARMGEPTWNDDVLLAAQDLQSMNRKVIGADVIHPVVSTMLPRANQHLKGFLKTWVFVKNTLYRGDAGLQFSINSTDDKQRDWLFGGSSLTLQQIAAIAQDLKSPLGRKYTLNFCINELTIINAKRLASLFNPDQWIVKLTPVHCAKEAMDNGVYGKFWYKKHEEACKTAGFDVIVFVPSADEESGRITCGNLLLAQAEQERSEG